MSVTGNLDAATARARVREPMLNVNEIFGPVWQGEGPATGERCAFLRLANCNLNCGKGEGSTWWCDTPYTWDWTRHDRVKEVHPMSVWSALKEVYAILGMHTRLLVISGGEPLLQKYGLDHLVQQVMGHGVSVDIETNGTRPPLEVEVRRYVCSPKLANSGITQGRRLVGHILRELEESPLAQEPTAFKFVATRPSDLTEVDAIVDDHGLTNVWIMPGGTTAAEILSHAKTIASAVEVRGYNLSLRQQVLLNGDVRGT